MKTRQTYIFSMFEFILISTSANVKKRDLIRIISDTFTAFTVSLRALASRPLNMYISNLKSQII